MQVSFIPPAASGNGDARYPDCEFFASVAWSRLAGAGALRAQVLLPRGLPVGPHSLRLGRESAASQPSPLSVTPPGTSAPPLALTLGGFSLLAPLLAARASRYSLAALGSRKGPPSSPPPPHPPSVTDEDGASVSSLGSHAASCLFRCPDSSPSLSRCL